MEHLSDNQEPADVEHNLQGEVRIRIRDVVSVVHVIHYTTGRDYRVVSLIPSFFTNCTRCGTTRVEHTKLSVQLEQKMETLEDIVSFREQKVTNTYQMEDLTNRLDQDFTEKKEMCQILSDSRGCQIVNEIM